ncbi:MAG: hypothetical protein JXP34_01925 [Planctomycetes bacterium]|nr:hypothetical protein [Planctomycetota bacterium]
MIGTILLLVVASLVTAFVTGLLKASDPREVAREGFHFAFLIVVGIAAFSVAVFAIGVIFGGGLSPSP